MIIDSPIISGSYLSTGSLSQTGNVAITGSLEVTNGISGSGANLFGIPASGITGLNLSQISSGSVSASISPNLGLLINTSVSASNFTGSFTGSLTGTATSASYAYTASSAISASYSYTASSAINASASLVAISASYAFTASSAISASYSQTASYLLGYISPFPYTGSAAITGSLVVTGSVAISTLVTSSGVRYVLADQNGLLSAQTASAAIFITQQVISTANQTTFPITNGYATGYVTVFVNGTKLSTDEFVDTSGTNIVFLTGSNAGDVVEFQKYLPAAGVSNNTLRTTNYFTTTLGQTTFNVNYTPGLLDVFYNGSKLDNTEYTAANGTSITLATGSNAGDKVEVDVYSYQVGAFSGIGGTGVANQLAYFNTTNSITGSNNFTVSGSAIIVTGSLIVSGSGTLINIGPAVFSGSVTSTGGFSGSFTGLADNATSASYAYTASSAINSFNAISASKAVSASYADTASYANNLTVMGNLTVFGTQSVQYITSSQLNVSNNVITVNVGTPGVRFGGLSVYDSGSTAGATGSLFWDSQNNNWVYQQVTGSTYSGGMLISGPRNTGGLGNEAGTTNNAVMKGMGGDHITSSAIFEVSGSVTMGTAITNSHSITGSLNITGSTIINGAFVVTGSGGIYASIKSVGGSDAAVYYNDGTNTAYSGLNVGSASNKFVIYHANAVRLAVDTSGNVGIGVTSPDTKLHISGSDGIKIQATGNSDTPGLTIINYTNQYGWAKFAGGLQGNGKGYANISCWNGSTIGEVVRISGDSNVGINANSPDQKLVINQGATGTGQGIPATTGTTQNGILRLRPAIGTYGETLDFGMNVSTTYAWIQATNASGLGTNYNLALNPNGGNIGIGITTPQGPLDVYRSTTGGLGGHIILRNNGSAVANETAVMFVDGDISTIRAAISSTTEGSPYFGNIAFKTGLGTYSSLTTRMTITGAGKVGIGVTSPDQALHVTDTGNDTVMKLGGGGAARDCNFSMYSQSATNTVTAIHYNGQMAFYNSKFTIQSSGAASLVGALTQNTSDIRLKTNVAIIENAIDKIKQLSGFTYNWNSLANELGGFDTTIKEIGVAAQSVKDVVPEAVHPAPFDNAFNPATQSFYSKSGENYLTVQYEKLVPLLIEGIKEQQVLIQELQEKLQRNNIN